MTHQQNETQSQGTVRERDAVAGRTVERREQEKAPWRRPGIRSLGALADTEGTSIENPREFNNIHKPRS